MSPAKLFASGFSESGTVVSHDFAPVDDASTHLSPALTLVAIAFPVALGAVAAASSSRFDGPLAAVGAAASLAVWLCAFTLRGTRMRRPCAVFWHAWTGAGVVYCAALAAALFVPLATSQAALAVLDPVHATGAAGAALPDKSYAENCELTVANVRGQTDIFVAAHVLGWVGKSLMFRDVWVSLALSAIFEFFEYTFTYLLPNFNECWWDHWVLDFVVCNGAGIVIGHCVLRALDAREYNWFGLAPAARARAALPVGPRAWRGAVAAQSVARAFGVLGLFALVIAVDLNAFFLKFIMKVQPASFLNPARLALMAFLGAAAFREYYGLLAHARAPGAAGVVAAVGIALEVALIAKHAGAVDAWRGARMPRGIAAAWLVGGALVAGLYSLGYSSAASAARRGKREDAAQLAPAAATADPTSPAHARRRRAHF
jgi:phosphatidylserine synthase 2